MNGKKKFLYNLPLLLLYHLFKFNLLLTPNISKLFNNLLNNCLLLLIKYINFTNRINNIVFNFFKKTNNLINSYQEIKFHRILNKIFSEVYLKSDVYVLLLCIILIKYLSFHFYLLFRFLFLTKFFTK